LDATLQDHLAILTALESRNSKLAEKAMRKHLSRVRSLMQSIIFYEQMSENANKMGKGILSLT
jgi:DNA-binding GntR family transcriptional regulator